MGRVNDPATLVLCASLPRGLKRHGCERLLDGRGPGTWAADIDSLATVAAAARDRGTAPPDLALSLEPAWLDSRATLRRMVAAARQAAGVATAVLRGPRPLAHQALLAEEGIRVVVVDASAVAGPGSRRPAPAGWRCRNPVWGLWEVQIDPPRPTGFVGLLRGSMPLLRPGTLHVLHAGEVPAERPVSGRLDRWLAWADRRQAGGRLQTSSLSALPAIIASGFRPPVTGSVLQAA